MDRAEDCHKPELAPFVPVPRFVVDRLANMRPGALVLYVILLSHRNYKTGRCNPSLNLLARRMGVSHDTVQRSLAILEVEGLVTRSRAVGQSSAYEFPHLTTRMDACSSDGTTRIDAAQPHAPVRCDHTQNRLRNKEEQEEKNRTTNKSGQSNFDPLRVSLPAWLPLDAWEEFVEHRRTLRSPLTELAAKKNIKKLDELRAAGHDPRAVIDESIANGWKGLFEVKQPSQGAKKPATRPNVISFNDLPSGKVQ